MKLGCTGRIAPAVLAILAGTEASALADSAPPPGPASTLITPVRKTDAEIACMADAIYYEAGFEPREGREAVAEVILNRLGDPRFPKTICGVVYQGSRRATGCQFTFTCDGSLGRPPQPAAYEEARAIAQSVLERSESAGARTPGANHYHADYVSPRWARTMTEVNRIGRHIFYSDRGGRAPFAVSSAHTVPTSGFSPWGLPVTSLARTRE